MHAYHDYPEMHGLVAVRESAAEDRRYEHLVAALRVLVAYRHDLDTVVVSYDTCKLLYKSFTVFANGDGKVRLGHDPLEHQTAVDELAESVALQ